MRREALLSAATEQDGLAIGALVYDADGSLSPAMQEERAEQFRTKAAQLRRQAAEL